MFRRLEYSEIFDRIIAYIYKTQKANVCSKDRSFLISFATRHLLEANSMS